MMRCVIAAGMLCIAAAGLPTPAASDGSAGDGSAGDASAKDGAADVGQGGDAGGTDGPLAVVTALFDAMRAGDGAAVRPLVMEGASLNRVMADGRRRAGSFETWANWVDRQDAGAADERIFNVRVDRFGPLASVWAPFKLYFNGELATCGVNHFILNETDAGWRIVHGIDTPHAGDCATFNPDP
ncbi:hypothetical protein BXY39_0692 [Eilatimonas milleporae]|uniref:Lumazine-binding protein n=1 Tax=Eilatimonas milleporae TaxID=911205 RepID=A0A3M0CUL9_9PROT|nr:hypothetical protein BXY39_0692 [Eilatimonas milleporae]